MSSKPMESKGKCYRGSPFPQKLVLGRLLAGTGRAGRSLVGAESRCLFVESPAELVSAVLELSY
jgi:hypothetical protein